MDFNFDKIDIANTLNNTLMNKYSSFKSNLHILDSQIKNKFQDSVDNLIATTPVSSLPNTNDFETIVNQEIHQIENNLPKPQLNNNINDIVQCLSGLDVNGLLGFNLDFNIDLPSHSVLDIIYNFENLILDRLESVIAYCLNSVYQSFPEFKNVIEYLQKMQEFIPTSIISELIQITICLETIITPSVTYSQIINDLDVIGLRPSGKVNYSKFGVPSDYENYIVEVDNVQRSFWDSVNNTMNINTRIQKLF